MRPLPAALACCVAAASSSAEEDRPSPPTAVRIDFGATEYPPLTKKWGGVEHPQWDTVTGEIALYWEEPRDTRETRPTATDNGRLTRKLHDGEAGDLSSAGSQLGSGRGSGHGSSASGSVCSATAPSTPR